jgi:hypothetical protein
MAGALYEVWNRDKTFDIFYTTGAGTAFGLSFVAAKGKNPGEAMKAMMNAGIHEAIYSWFPLGFKTFFKAGPFTVPIRNWTQQFKISNPTTSQHRLFNDWVDLWTAAITPTTTNFSSQGLCAHSPFLDDVIDFTKLKTNNINTGFTGEFYTNAYCIDDKKVEEFDKAAMDEAHFNAALSYPFIYPPTEIAGKYYYEGSALEPLNFPDNGGHKFGPKHTHLGNLNDKIGTGPGQIGSQPTFIVMDVLGPLEKALIRTPRHIVDAYGISIMTPVVALAKMMMDQFRNNAGPGNSNKLKGNLRVIDFASKIPTIDYPTLCDWSSTNLDKLFEYGRQACSDFLTANGNEVLNLLPDIHADTANAV